jgi:hypothetical protein
MTIQNDLFAPSIPQRFEAWKATPGGGQVLRRAYRIASFYGRRYIRTGRRVSIRLIWERLRDRIDGIRSELARRGIKLPKENGFLLNDHFAAHVARHIMEHRTEWKGMLETRELGVKRKTRKVIVIEEAA